ncbi:hypothetical protein [uncultured Paraglaciecola sp.]|nr:hypothetical protein [uncultured Paraglaciecola sp.]
MNKKQPHHSHDCSYYLRSHAVFPNIRASFVAATIVANSQQTAKE